MTVTETLRYRGAIGQWSWALHRISGLGVIVFLVMHIVDTSWSVFYPKLYEEAIATYQTPLFTIGEFALIACVVYHAYNGLRIIIIDFKPRWWRYQQKAAIYVLIATAITLVPVFILMFGDVLDYYGSDPELLGLGDVIKSVLPFAVGAVVAIVAALVFSSLAGLVAGGGAGSPAKTGSNTERFWWSFMRISGLLILPLVFGHLAVMHVLQGVFDISVQNADIIGASAANSSGTAVEFVGNRWNELVAGVAFWRIYDLGLLAFAVLHGANGLRYVLTDYTMGNRLLRRAAVYVCVIGAVVLLMVGGAALMGSIESTAINMAEDARIEMGIGIRTLPEEGEEAAPADEAGATEEAGDSE